MRHLVASRFQIELNLLELDDQGEPVNEYPQPPVVLFGITAVRGWLEQLPGQVRAAERELDTQKGATDGRNPEPRAPLPRTG
jgi:hypothetical protein